MLIMLYWKSPFFDSQPFYSFFQNSRLYSSQVIAFIYLLIQSFEAIISLGAPSPLPVQPSQSFRYCNCSSNFPRNGSLVESSWVPAQQQQQL